ncbi:MAG: PP2C family protein-serine/threonine phosphatase [Kiritimatiellae bacterium]|nr:PP2C family protein-serine/threonine phosphatase [Kiritimatiellia bacterium]
MKAPFKIPRWMIYTLLGLMTMLLIGLNAGLFLTAMNPPEAGAGCRIGYPAAALSSVLSLALMVGLFLITKMALTARYTSASNEMLSIAEWVYRNVIQRRTPEIPVTEGEALQKQVEDWYYERQHDVDQQVDARTEEWTKELKMATDFQLAMLERPYPAIPEIHITDRVRLNFFHRYQPASGLGGDFFDIIKVDRDVGGIFIADVMGHGTRSALITSILRTLMSEAMQVGRNAPHFLGQVNKSFCDILKTIPDLVFASAFYFVADTTARVVTFSSAGHPPPLHIRRSINRVEYMNVPPPRAAALGVLPDEEFPGGNMRIQPEDVYIFYTDGLTEAFNPDGDEFGEERARRVVERYMYQDIKTIINNLYAAVVEWADGRPMADDICLIAVETTTKPPPKPDDESEKA